MSRDTSRWDSPASSAIWKNWVIKSRGEYSARLNAVRLTSGSECSLWPTVTASEDSYRIGGNSQQSKCLSAMARRGEMSCQPASINWPTPEAFVQRGPIKTELTETGFLSYHGNQRYGAKLSDAVNCGPPAPDNHSTHGSRPESWSTPTVTDASAMSPEMRPSRIATGRTTEYLARQIQWGTPTARDHKSGRGKEDRDYKELTPMVERTQAGKLNPRWVETLMGVPIGWTTPSCTSPVTIAQTSCASLATE